MITLQTAQAEDVETVLSFDPLKRKEIIKNAILQKSCYLAYSDKDAVGFAIFNHSFFGNGWLDLIEVKECLQGKGYGGQIIGELYKYCKTEKFFTSTNKSNLFMQKCITKIGFSFVGQVDGLDEGDPELFFLKRLDRRNQGISGTDGNPAQAKSSK